MTQATNRALEVAKRLPEACSGRPPFMPRVLNTVSCWNAMIFQDHKHMSRLSSFPIRCSTTIRIIWIRTCVGVFPSSLTQALFRKKEEWSKQHLSYLFSSLDLRLLLLRLLPGSRLRGQKRSGKANQPLHCADFSNRKHARPIAAMRPAPSTASCKGSQADLGGFRVDSHLLRHFDACEALAKRWAYSKSSVCVPGRCDSLPHRARTVVEKAEQTKRRHDLSHTMIGHALKRMEGNHALNLAMAKFWRICV